jgi:hypothetical protein
VPPEGLPFHDLPKPGSGQARQCASTVNLCRTRQDWNEAGRRLGGNHIQKKQTAALDALSFSHRGCTPPLNTVKARASASDGVQAGPYPRDHAAENIVTSGPALLQEIALVLCGDLDGGDVSLEDAVSVEEDTGAHEDRAAALSDQSLLAMARSDWGRAEVFAGQARTAVRRAGIEESYATPLVSSTASWAPPPAARRSAVPAGGAAG